jgi:hypothetical protein
MMADPAVVVCNVQWQVGIRGRHKTCLYGALGLFGLLAIINIGRLL